MSGKSVYSRIFKQILKQVYRRTEKRYSDMTNFNIGCKFDVISKLYDFNEKLSRDSYSDIGVIIKLKSM